MTGTVEAGAARRGRLLLGRRQLLVASALLAIATLLGGCYYDPYTGAYYSYPPYPYPYPYPYRPPYSPYPNPYPGGPAPAPPPGASAPVQQTPLPPPS